MKKIVTKYNGSQIEIRKKASFSFLLILCVHEEKVHTREKKMSNETFISIKALSKKKKKCGNTKEKKIRNLLNRNPFFI